MKKVLLVLGILLCLSSCEEPLREPKNIKEEAPRNVYKFTFEEHDYIHFSNNGGYDSQSGYVHDPECRKCKENK